MLESGDLRKGLKFEMDGEPYVVVQFEFVKPGKGQALYKCKLKNMVTGVQFDKTFRSGEKFNEADLEEAEMEYLYAEGNQYCFMNTSTYEQEYLSEDQRNRYRTAWSQPSAMTAMINWYRAAALRGRTRMQVRKVKAPTLVLWGLNDPYLSYEMAQPSVELCENGRLVTFNDASHWVLQDKPDETSRLMIEHFRGA